MTDATGASHVADNKSKTTVSILVQNLPVPFDRRVWQEATELSQAGYLVTVVCPADRRHPAGRFVQDGVQIIRYAEVKEANSPQGYLREYAQSLWRMRRAIVATEPSAGFDIVHLCNPPDLLFLLGLRSKLRYKSQVIFDQHDLGPELVRAKAMPMQRLFVGVAKLLERMTYYFSDHVISTNESYAEIAAKRGRKSSAEVTVVRSGPRRDWAEGKQAVGNQAWRRGRKFLLGYVGVMGRQEGIEYLLQAMRRIVVDRGFDVQLALVGAGPEMQQLRQSVSDLGLHNYVEFHGRLSDDDLISVLRESDVCVNPDEVNELNNLSTMNKILEYMALGKPMVQFDVREGKVSAGNSSAYAQPNDANSFADEIIKLLENPSVAIQMGQAGVQRFRESLCWETQAPKLLGVYSTLGNSRVD